MSPRLEREAAMDDMADHAARFAPIASPIPDQRAPARYVPRALMSRYEAISRSINSEDTANAVTWMHEHGELPEEVNERIGEMEQHFAEKRINSGEFSRPKATGFFGLAQDACAALFEVVQAKGIVSEADVARFAKVCARAGYRI